MKAIAPKLMRYSQAAIGPVASAGAQFLLSLVALRLLPPGDFGTFAFLLIASQLSWGLWSALFCAPLPILLASGDAAARKGVERTLLTTNLLASLAAAIVFALLATTLGVPPVAALVFAVYGAVALLRWFARAHGYATGTPTRTMASDLAYGLVIVAGTGVLAATGTTALTAVYAVLLAGAVLGMLPFGARYLRAQFAPPDRAAIRSYGAIWRLHSGWSLLGVLTTEATANSHAYLVTGLSGPAAFAPLAASALLIRPIGVAMNALTEFERAQMARQIGARQIVQAIGSVRLFRIVLIAAWSATALGIAALLGWAPQLVFPDHYDVRFLTIAALLWLGVSGMRIVRAPESALLQAAGAFRPLAFASVWSSAGSLAAVVALLMIGGPLWSIAGIAVGEAIFATLTYIQAHRWRRAELARDHAEELEGAT